MFRVAVSQAVVSKRSEQSRGSQDQKVNGPEVRIEDFLTLDSSTLKSITDKNSQRTFAHNLAGAGQLPKNFNMWDLADQDGWTVGFEAASYGKLPSDFNQWDLKGPEGISIAHIAAASNTLPPNFSQWNLETDSGLSVKDVVDQFKDFWNNFSRGNVAKDMPDWVKLDLSAEGPGKKIGRNRNQKEVGFKNSLIKGSGHRKGKAGRNKGRQNSVKTPEKGKGIGR